MRPYAIALAAILAAGLTAHAQTTPTPPAPDPKKLDEYLQRWEQEMQKIQTLSATLERTQKDAAFQVEKKFTGYAQYMKAGSGQTVLNLAILEMKEEGKKEFCEKYICTGTFLYQFRPSEKAVYAHRLPTPKPGQVGDDNFMSFLFGMKAAQAKEKYGLELSREDQYYIYVEVKPRTQQDKEEFKRAQIVLSKETFLPRQLWFEKPTGDQVVWGIPRIDTKAKLNKEDFDAPKLPDGWKMIEVEKKNEAPNVVRPMQP
jgi:TIGR03009 family protein